MLKSAASGWLASSVRLADSSPLELTGWSPALPPLQAVMPLAVMPSLVMVGQGCRPPHSNVQTRAHVSSTTVSPADSLK